ncbi:TonB-dependent receptor [Actomonas aquatica]|uniref:TonB-dependent receptor n=1 Tax=Actomonas aquatica TaxID=2866162 RepID=A0ABZ1C6B0_9BACT|nr:TonB-dependent receptor [Opitutus sp. WL0086]WRQ86900.1 TonB-dependent receptor [Opitutus sp. WL0086]
MKSKSILLSLLVLPGAVLSFAQTTVPTDSEVLTLDALEVTGEKLGRTLQESQISVAALRGVELEASTDTEMSEIFNRTANTFTSAQGFTIRGIPNSGFTFSEGSDMATVLVDGATVDAQMYSFEGVSVWDMDQVEILRGPQSTTQGRNSLAGAVIARTRAPTFYWDGALRATYGENNTHQLALAAGGPLVPDLLAFRVTVDDRSTDGSITNVTRNEDDWEYAENRTLRGKLLLQPKSWQGFSALATFAHTDSANNNRAYAYGSTIDELYDRLAYENTAAMFDSESKLASLEINQEFANGWLLTATTGWSDLIVDTLYDGDRTPTEDLEYGYGYDNDSLTQEIRLLAKGDTWSLLTGLYYAESLRSYYSDGPFYYTVPAPLDQVFGLPTGARALLSVQSDSSIETTNQAIYLNGDWEPNERWTLSAGLRFDREEADRDSAQNILLLQGFPDNYALIDVPSLGIPAGTPANVALQAIAGDATAAALGDDAFNTVLPSAGITYHWTPDISTGLSYTRGYRSGGVSFNQRRASIVGFDPEFTSNYEFSFRSVWQDGKVMFNANAFYVDWTDQQVAVQLSSDVYDRQVENAGQSEYYGFEVELREDLGHGWSAYQSLGHTQTEFVEFTSTAGDYSGNAFPNSPQWTLSAGLSYQRAEGLFGNLAVSYVDDSFTAAENDPDFVLPARTLVNAKLGYRWGQWSAYVYAQNLFDEDYLDNLWSQSATLLGARPGAPRVAGVGIEAKF